MFECLFKSLRIGSVEIPNRFIVPAMESKYVKDHMFTESAAEYYGDRPRGGFGLIITEFLAVSKNGLASKTEVGIYDDSQIESHRMVTDCVHRAGGVIFAQIHHAGRIANTSVTGSAAVGASSIPGVKSTEPVHMLTTEEVYQVIDNFIAAADRAKKAGYDGVEIHGAHGYLLSQFLSKASNKRTDEFGGSIINRTRIIGNIISGIKNKCGEDFPVGVRIQSEDTNGANTIYDLKAIACALEAYGADILNITNESSIRSYFTDPGFNMSCTNEVKKNVRIPVIGIGRINDPMIAELLIKEGCADAIAFGRESICEPELPLKIKENRLDEIFTCTGCIQRCYDTKTFEELDDGLSCMINPFSGRSKKWKIKEAEKKKNILVAGAGVAGLQAAWILAARGHNVTVVEKNALPGGQYLIAAIPPKKQDLAKTIQTYMTLGRKHGVKYYFETGYSERILDEMNADVLINATGSAPVVPHIEGNDLPNVTQAHDVLQGYVNLKSCNILILGAGLVGCETAEYLLQFDNKITIVDMLHEPAVQMPKLTRTQLLQNLNQSSVQWHLDAKVSKIIEDGVCITENNTENELHGFDRVVLAFGVKSRADLPHGNAEYYVIGDAFSVADAKKAIYEANVIKLSAGDY